MENKSDIIVLMMNLIKEEVCLDENQGTAFICDSLSEDELNILYKLSDTHDVAHLVGDALDKKGLLSDSEISQKFKKKVLLAKYRFVMLEAEFEDIVATLEKAKIYYMPLKGSIIRKFYPQEWMRTSCDIDVLIHEEDLEAVLDIYKEKNGYAIQKKNAHDVCVVSKSGIHVEFHYKLIEDDFVEKIDLPLLSVWDTSIKSENSYACSMSNELFYYYHISHIAKHFVMGGCGIRPFLDIIFINKKLLYDRNLAEKILNDGGVFQFCENCELLSKVWFENEKHNSLTLSMQNYILKGGVYGTISNKVVSGQVSKGGKVKYLFSRIWMPYKNLIYLFPSLENRKILLPFYQIARWFKIIFMGGFKRSVKEFGASSKISKKEAKEILNMMKELGLNK